MASGAAWGRPAGVSFPWEKLPLLLDVARSEGRALVEPKFLACTRTSEPLTSESSARVHGTSGCVKDPLMRGTGFSRIYALLAIHARRPRPSKVTLRAPGNEAI